MINTNTYQGAEIESREYDVQNINSLPIPVKGNRVFEGWYIDPELTISNNHNWITLYARWV